MKNSILVDTTIIVDFLRRKNKEETYLYKLSEKDIGLFISIITHTELFAGKSVWEKKEARVELDNIFGGFTLLPLDELVSRKAGEIRTKVKVDLIDAIIAATALEYKYPLATLNTKHFQSIRKLSLFDLDLKHSV